MTATLTLTKPALEYTSQERAEIYAGLYRSLISGLVPDPDMSGRLSGQQIAWAKGRAWRTMRLAGF